MNTRTRLVILGLMSITLITLATRADVLQSILQVFTGHQLEVAGDPVPANHPKLSEHNIEWVHEQEPQAQAEFLLGAAIRYEQGATDLIAELIESWQGQLSRTQEWDFLTRTALYSSDLRVRAAAIEIELAVNRIAIEDASVDRLITLAENNESQRAWSVWTLGMLANRGLQTERVFEILVEYTYDPVPETRLWAVEGLAHMGTDATLEEFVRVLGTDPSMDVRERAGCSLAKSGMLTRRQRMQAVPGLLDLADDPNLEDRPRKWVYQALREITNVALPNDPGEWRYWHSTDGAEVTQRFGAEPWQVLGNN